MPHPECKRPVTIVSAVMRADGLPDFADILGVLSF